MKRRRDWIRTGQRLKRERREKRQWLRECSKKLVAQATPAELRLSEALTAAGYCFRFQHPLLGLIPDFFFPESNLLVEVDGGYHNHPEKRESDRARDEEFRLKGFRTIRFWNAEVMNGLEGVLKRIEKHAKRSLTLKVDRPVSTHFAEALVDEQCGHVRAIMGR